MSDAPLTLIIETPTGVLVRSIPGASPLSAGTGGTAAEAATQDAAALWGLPDFVYTAQVVRVGSGSREVGDRLLVVGDAGAVVQVKRRVGATTDKARERQWVLLRRDWEFLFVQLKSTLAVIGYLRRVAGESIELGDEPVRYFDCALADAKAEPAPMRPELLGATARRVSAPLLPMNAAGADDERSHLLVRSIFEDIALAQLRDRSELDRLRALSELDRLPVAQRVGIGRFVLEAMELVSKAPDGETMWQHRRLLSDEDSPTPVQLAYGACSHPWDDFIRDTFGWWVQLRHHELGEALGSYDGLTTIGVVFTPRYEGVRPWDTSMVSAVGDLQLDQETVEVYRRFWPRQD